MESTAKKEAERIIGKLKVAIRLLGFTNREIERRLSYTPSYLTRLFSGQIELRFEHIVDIARAMGLTADEFFAFAYPARNDEPSETARQLDTLLEELRPSPRPPKASPPLGGLTEEGIELKLMKLFKDHFDSLGERKPSPPRKRKA
jgi:transcriptional regulator with XRE-family HTH domain